MIINKRRLGDSIRKAYADVVARRLEEMLQYNGITGLKVGYESNDLWPDVFEHDNLHYIYVMPKDEKLEPCRVCCGDPKIFIYPVKNIFQENGKMYPLTTLERLSRLDELIFDPGFYKELGEIRVNRIRKLDDVMEDLTSKVNDWLDNTAYMQE